MIEEKEKIELNEESEEFATLRQRWYAMADDPSIDVVQFINELASYKHDYGTSVWAVVVSLRKMMNTMKEVTPLDEDQKTMLLWLTLEALFDVKSQLGARVVRYESLLDPQNEQAFTHIPYNVWENLKQKAKVLLATEGDYMLPSTRAHLNNIASGRPPFGLAIGRE